MVIIFLQMVLVAAGGAKESLGGQECADADSHNDRLLYTMNEDVTISGCWFMRWSALF